MSEEVLTPPEGEVPPQDTPPVDPYASIKEKYNNNLDDMAKAYKNMQSEHDKFKSQYITPDEYVIQDEYSGLDASQIESLKAVAKKGSFTQAQFDTLLADVKEKVDSHTKTTEEANAAFQAEREKALSAEDKDKLKSFYKGKMPETVLDTILESGSAEELSNLKAFRDASFSKTPHTQTKATGNTMDIEQQISEKRLALQNLCGTEVHKTIEEKEVIERQKRALSIEIRDLTEKLGPKTLR